VGNRLKIKANVVAQQCVSCLSVTRAIARDRCLREMKHSLLGGAMQLLAARSVAQRALWSGCSFCFLYSYEKNVYDSSMLSNICKVDQSNASDF